MEDVMKSQAIESRVLSELLALGFLVLFLLIPRAMAGAAEESQLLQAREFSDKGEFAQVVRILVPLVRNESGTLDDVSHGRAWNLLGPAYEALGDYEAARNCYEATIRLLRSRSDAVVIYASALNNLGSLEIYSGQLKAAGARLRKAQGLYSKADDHVGMAEVETNLAILALDGNDIHDARDLLKDAFAQAEHVSNFSDSDRAEMLSIKGAVASRDRDFHAAVVDFQQSIELWIRARGPGYYLVALQYTLQADAYRELGDYNKAKSDITVALHLLDQIAGGNTPTCAAAELSYARLLRATGANAEAAQRESEAKTILEEMRRQQCNGCSISAAGLR
jgi:tetratricopeptide (TPR) repeat protein